MLLAQELLSLFGSLWNEALPRGLSNTGHRSAWSLVELLLSLFGSPWNEPLLRGLCNTGHRSERSLAEHSLFAVGFCPFMAQLSLSLVGDAIPARTVKNLCLGEALHIEINHSIYTSVEQLSSGTPYAGAATPPASAKCT